jgi:hypothetical protein
MPYRNDYEGIQPIPEQLWHADTPKEEYDLHFAYPVPQEDLSTGSVLIRPLIVRFFPFLPRLPPFCLFLRFVRRSSFSSGLIHM